MRKTEGLKFVPIFEIESMFLSPKALALEWFPIISENNSPFILSFLFILLTLQLSCALWVQSRNPLLVNNSISYLFSMS